MFDTCQQADYSLRLRIASCIGSCYQAIVVVYVEKHYLAGVGNLVKSPAGRFDTKEPPTTKAAYDAAPWSTQRYVIAIIKTFLTQEEIILAHTGMCCLLLPKNRQVS